MPDPLEQHLLALERLVTLLADPLELDAARELCAIEVQRVRAMRALELERRRPAGYQPSTVVLGCGHYLHEHAGIGELPEMCVRAELES